MIRGKVTGDQQALVTVDIMDGDDLLQPIEVILDTGFTGSLTLPTDSHQRTWIAFRRTQDIRAWERGTLRIRGVPCRSVMAWTLE